MGSATVLVTVGSTAFSALIHTALHPAFLDALESEAAAGHQERIQLIIQYGSSTLPFLLPTPTFAHGKRTSITLLPYTSDLAALIRSADVVISHAGSGTLLEVLRAETRPALIAVPNRGLMDDHQAELALALGEQGYLLVGHVGNSGGRRGSTKRKAEAEQDDEPEEVIATKLAAQVHLALASKQRRESQAGTSKETTETKTETIQPFPSWQPDRFATLVDHALGF